MGRTRFKTESERTMGGVTKEKFKPEVGKKNKQAQE